MQEFAWVCVSLREFARVWEFSKVFESFQKFFRVFEIFWVCDFESFWEFLRVFKSFWQFENFWQFSRVLKVFKSFWEFESFWQFIKGFESFWRFLRIFTFFLTVACNLWQWPCLHKSFALELSMFSILHSFLRLFRPLSFFDLSFWFYRTYCLNSRFLFWSHIFYFYFLFWSQTIKVCGGGSVNLIFLIVKKNTQSSNFQKPNILMSLLFRCPP